MDLFFGPSKIFGTIFKAAMIKTFDHKIEEKKDIDKDPKLNAPGKEDLKMRSKKLVDEIFVLEQ